MSYSCSGVTVLYSVCTLFTLFSPPSSPCCVGCLSTGNIPKRTASNISVLKCTHTHTNTLTLTHTHNIYTHMLWKWSLDNITKSGKVKLAWTQPSRNCGSAKWKFGHSFTNFFWLKWNKYIAVLILLVIPNLMKGLLMQGKTCHCLYITSAHRCGRPLLVKVCSVFGTQSINAHNTGVTVCNPYLLISFVHVTFQRMCKFAQKIWIYITTANLAIASGFMVINTMNIYE